MKILAIESSGKTAGCAYAEDGVLISEYYINSKLTHSKTLLPMVEEMVKNAGIMLSELDAVAVSAGPGSFTGLRIGAATAKGLTLALEKPIVPVSSLMGLARNAAVPGVILCPLMDARRGEVYCAVYAGNVWEEEKMAALLPDSAMSIDAYLLKVKEIAEESGEKCCFLGDGVPVHREKIKETLGETAFFAPEGLGLQRASSIALLGCSLFAEGKTTSSDNFVPTYLRVPLAETEKKAGILGDAGEHSLEKIGRGDFKRTRHPLEGDKNA